MDDDLASMSMTWEPSPSDLLMLANRVLVSHEWQPQITEDKRFREYRNPYNLDIITVPTRSDDPDIDAYLGQALASMHRDGVAFHLYELSGIHLGNMIAIFLDDHAIDGTLAAVHHELVGEDQFTTVTFADRTSQTLPSNRVCMC